MMLKMVYIILKTQKLNEKCSVNIFCLINCAEKQCIIWSTHKTIIHMCCHYIVEKCCEYNFTSSRELKISIIWAFNRQLPMCHSFT